MFRKTWLEKLAKHFVSKRCPFHATRLKQNFSSVVLTCCLWQQTASLRRQALTGPHKQVKLNACRRTCNKIVTLNHVTNIRTHSRIKHNGSTENRIQTHATSNLIFENRDIQNETRHSQNERCLTNSKLIFKERENSYAGLWWTELRKSGYTQLQKKHCMSKKLHTFTQVFRPENNCHTCSTSC